MSLTNPNTPVSQQDLQDFYHKLLPYLGGSFGLVATGIDSANLYSTTERVVGQWIDGKPLYQRVVDCGTLTSKPDVYIPVSGSSEMNVVNMHGFIDMNGVVEPLPYVHDTELANMIAVKFRKSTGINLFARNNTSVSDFHAYVTLQYTKTTDSAVESYGTDTTYSTDEHVVGSWIDGKPVYQKTFAGTSGANGADATFGSINNAETIVSLRGIVRNSNNMMHGAPNPGLYLKYYNGNIQTYTSDAQFGNQPCSITVQYTKSS